MRVIANSAFANGAPAYDVSSGFTYEETVLSNSSWCLNISCSRSPWSRFLECLNVTVAEIKLHSEKYFGQFCSSRPLKCIPIPSFCNSYSPEKLFRTSSVKSQSSIVSSTAVLILPITWLLGSLLTTKNSSTSVVAKRALSLQDFSAR